MEKAILNVKYFCEYLGIGETKSMEHMKKEKFPNALRIGNRLYANKAILDKWLASISGKC